MAEAWYNLSVVETLSKLGSSTKGLGNEEARRRLEQHGPNELTRTVRVSPYLMFLQQFNNTLVIVLIIAAAIAGALEEWVDTTVILVIVFINAILGFAQEYKAERSLEALKELAAPRCHVIREGETATIQARELVPGDIVQLAAGDKIPSDLRLIETSGLRVNEAPLTGESTSISKNTEKLHGTVFLGDRKNMCFMGCIVEAGRGTGAVTSTGMKTELGMIAGLVQAEPPAKTPLQHQLERLGKQIGVVVLAIVVITFLIEYMRFGKDIVQLFLTSVSLAVAAIPEGLVAVVTISLALGLQRMARRNALIRRLPAVETLGSATVICTDKTGTLTRGEMNVVTIHAGGLDYRVEGEGFNPEGRVTKGGTQVDLKSEPELSLLLKTAMLCNDATVQQSDGAWKVNGDTTEGALIVAGIRAGLSKENLEDNEPRVAEVAFTSERKMMSTVHMPLDKGWREKLKTMSEEDRLKVLSEAPYKVLFVKGAPERIFRACSLTTKDGKVNTLTDAERHELTYKNQELAAKGLRVLGLAYRELPPQTTTFSDESLERNLTFLGLVGMMDTPRKDAAEALKTCQKAGIKVVMITGDHKLTAMAVAADMGILKKGQKALTGEELDNLTEEQFLKIVEDVRVYARVSPEDKLLILNAWKKKGHVVVMTGDGVNDAPALKSSNLGVAMGITGTDVAKESSDMVLTDDNFASIVGAVEEGRGVYQNIRKFVRYLLSTNSGEVMTIFVAALVLLPLPLLPIQILWINLITDGLPAVALGVEPKERGLMKQRPRDPKAGILSGTIPYDILWLGVLMMIGSLSLFSWSLARNGETQARTLVFYTLTMFQMFSVLAMRVERESVFTVGFLRNRYMIWAVLSTVLLQLVVIYAPPIQNIFKTSALPLDELLIGTLVASSAFIAVELEKMLLRRVESRKAVG